MLLHIARRKQPGSPNIYVNTFWWMLRIELFVKQCTSSSRHILLKTELKTIRSMFVRVLWEVGCISRGWQLYGGMSHRRLLSCRSPWDTQPLGTGMRCSTLVLCPWLWPVLCCVRLLSGIPQSCGAPQKRRCLHHGAGVKMIVVLQVLQRLRINDRQSWRVQQVLTKCWARQHLAVMILRNS